MSVKLILLKSGETVISDAKELLYGEEEGKIVGYLLNNPFTITTQKAFFLLKNLCLIRMILLLRLQCLHGFF